MDILRSIIRRMGKLLAWKNAARLRGDIEERAPAG
jgi:hypothetical protein